MKGGVRTGNGGTVEEFKAEVVGAAMVVATTVPEEKLS